MFKDKHDKLTKSGDSWQT